MHGIPTRNIMQNGVSKFWRTNKLLKDSWVAILSKFGLHVIWYVMIIKLRLYFFYKFTNILIHFELIGRIYSSAFYHNLFGCYHIGRKDNRKDRLKTDVSK